MTAVGADYTTWEGYVDEASGRAVIGLSYDRLCQFLKPGNTILLSDGTITLKVGLTERGREAAEGGTKTKFSGRVPVSVCGCLPPGFSYVPSMLPWPHFPAPCKAQAGR